MKSYRRSLTQAIVRTAVVAGTGIAVGFLIFHQEIFIPTMVSFQFTISSITAGLSYAALRGKTPRNGLAALLIWYLVLMFLIEEFNSWLPILNLAYLLGIAGAIFVYEYVIRKLLVRGKAQRIAAAAVFTAIANGLIVVTLGLVTTNAIYHPARILEVGYHNVQIGTLIGLAIGIGMEIAEYLLEKLFDKKKVQGANVSIRHSLS
jgi:hypothetical protein